MKSSTLRIGLLVLAVTLGSVVVAEGATVERWIHDMTTGYVYVECSDGRYGTGYFAGASHSWVQQEMANFCRPGEIGNPMYSE